MKLLIALLLILPSTVGAQEVDLLVTKDNNLNELAYLDVFTVKIFNNSGQPLGLKSSFLLNKFSEKDTLHLAIKYHQADSIYYGIDKSEEDAKILEGSPYYQLLIINPQTYSIFKIKLSEFASTKNSKFSLLYTSQITEKDKQSLVYYDPKKVKIINEEKKFTEVIVAIPGTNTGRKN